MFFHATSLLRMREGRSEKKNTKIAIFFPTTTQCARVQCFDSVILNYYASPYLIFLIPLDRNKILMQ